MRDDKRKDDTDRYNRLFDAPITDNVDPIESANEVRLFLNKITLHIREPATYTSRTSV